MAKPERWAIKLEGCVTKSDDGWLLGGIIFVAMSGG
jgi:hypothetical protein